MVYSASRGCVLSICKKIKVLKKFPNFSKNVFFVKNWKNDQNREKSIFSQSAGNNENRSLYHKSKEKARATPKTTSAPESDEMSMRTVSDKIFSNCLFCDINTISGESLKSNFQKSETHRNRVKHEALAIVSDFRQVKFVMSTSNKCYSNSRDVSLDFETTLVFSMNFTSSKIDGKVG